ncbi:MAG: hypothetical protein IKJ90_07595 [Bacteroidaceae bacterium]|nr:hypothetical protein [Bacteroidaceae bacterium]
MTNGNVKTENGKLRVSKNRSMVGTRHAVSETSTMLSFVLSDTAEDRGQMTASTCRDTACHL